MTLKSGHCLTNRCDACIWPRCDHTCHTTAAELVAQTFDEGALVALDTEAV